MTEIQSRSHSVSLMPFRQYLFRICIALAIGSVALGCGPIERATVSVTPIATVLEQPNRETSVYIRGVVTNRIAILGNGLYEVEDDTGRVWVLSEDEVPALDSNVTVQGTSEGVMQLGGRHFGVTIKETRRL